MNSSATGQSFRHVEVVESIERIKNRTQQDVKDRLEGEFSKFLETTVRYGEITGVQVRMA